MTLCLFKVKKKTSFLFFFFFFCLLEGKKNSFKLLGERKSFDLSSLWQSGDAETIYLSASIRFGKQSHLHMGKRRGLGVRRGGE